MKAGAAAGKSFTVGEVGNKKTTQSIARQDMIYDSITLEEQ
jgi:hypothetical protein